jgi:amidase
MAWGVIGVSLAEWLEAFEIANTEVPPLAAALADEARAMPPTALFALTREMARLSFEADAMFDGLDALLMPVLSGPPVAVGTFDLSGTDTDAHRAGMAAFAPNVALANVAGLPALALPFGVADGLPVGGQLLGPVGSDAGLLALGAMIEARAPDLPFPHPIAGMPG